MESEKTEVYILDEMTQEAFAMDSSDEDVAIDVFEWLGTNRAIARGRATTEEFLQKSLARRDKR